MYSVIKFQSPFERLKSHDKVPEISLYKAIITQAVIDATNTSDFLEAKKNEIEAKNWIFGNSEGFITACQFSGLKASYVRKIAREAMILQQQKIVRSEKVASRRSRKTTRTEHVDKRAENPLCI